MPMDVFGVLACICGGNARTGVHTAEMKGIWYSQHSLETMLRAFHYSAVCIPTRGKVMYRDVRGTSH